MKIIDLIRRNKLLTLVLLAYLFLFITSQDKAYLSIKNSMYYIIEMLQVMPVIFILTSVIETWVPKEIIISSFGEKAGSKGVIFSFLLGSFSAGPIYAAFPISKMLLSKGASISNVVIILSSWAVIKVPMLANEAKFLGIRFMAIRWIFTVLSILFMSYIVSMFVKKDSIPIEAKEAISEITSVEIKEKYCIGCRLCEKSLPQHFEMVEGKARWRRSIISSEYINSLVIMISKCPVKAIDFK